MAFLALVRSARGSAHSAGAEHEAVLAQIHHLLERLQQKTDGPPKGIEGKALTLPPGVKEWYAGLPLQSVWAVQTCDDESQLYAHIAALHSLGIPTFLRESNPPSLLKFFATAEAHILDAFMPENDAERLAFWTSLHEGLAYLVVRAMAEVAVQLFGSRATSNIVAIFRASGFSVADSQWKVSLRISFQELAVTLETAQRARALLIQRLAGLWEAMPHEGWAAALRPQRSSERFWDRALEEVHAESRHRLVYCDTFEGDPLLPEERPLEPHALLHAVAKPHGVSVKRMLEDLGSVDWVRLGSVWSNRTTTTELRREPAPAERQLAHQAAPATTRRWRSFRDPRGQVFYQNPDTLETSWVLPLGVEAIPPP